MKLSFASALSRQAGGYTELRSTAESESLQFELKELKKTRVADDLSEDIEGKYYYPVAVGLLVYLSLSAEVFCWMDGKTRLDAIYMSVITFTTIGYGDLTPSHPLSKLYCCGFIFLNMLIVGQLLDFVVQAFVERRGQALQQLMERVFDAEDGKTGEDTGVSVGAGAGAGVAALHAGAGAGAGGGGAGAGGALAAEYRLLCCSLCKSLALIFATLLVGTLCFSWVVDQHGIIDSIYLSCMTISTVGYGDVVPTNDASKAFGCFYAVLGTIAFGSAISSFISAVSDFRILAKNDKSFNNCVLDYQTLCGADEDDNERVSRAEFVLFRLRQLGVVPEKLRQRAEQVCAGVCVWYR